MIKFIIEIASRLTPHSDMKPTTPASIEIMENATQREQSGFGIKMRDTPIIIMAAMKTQLIEVCRMRRNWSKNTKNGWYTVTLNPETKEARVILVYHSLTYQIIWDYLSDFLQ